jgi:hypothetical protein
MVGSLDGLRRALQLSVRHIYDPQTMRSYSHVEKKRLEDSTWVRFCEKNLEMVDGGTFRRAVRDSTFVEGQDQGVRTGNWRSSFPRKESPPSISSRPPPRPSRAEAPLHSAHPRSPSFNPRQQQRNPPSRPSQPRQSSFSPPLDGPKPIRISLKTALDGASQPDPPGMKQQSKRLQDRLSPQVALSSPPPSRQTRQRYFPDSPVSPKQMRKEGAKGDSQRRHPTTPIAIEKPRRRQSRVDTSTNQSRYQPLKETRELKTPKPSSRETRAPPLIEVKQLDVIEGKLSLEFECVSLPFLLPSPSTNPYPLKGSSLCRHLLCPRYSEWRMEQDRPADDGSRHFVFQSPDAVPSPP